MNEKLHGIIIPAVTPFDASGNVDLKSLKRNYELWNYTDIRGYMCLGSNGEFRSMANDESLEVIRVAGKYKAPDKTLIVGIGRESLSETLRFMHEVETENENIDYVSVLTPCYFANQMTDEALIDYYISIADQSKFPVLLYSAPSFANGVSISVEAVEELARHPNICGIKDTSKHLMEDYMRVLAGRDDFEVLSGTLSNLQVCLEWGGKGALVSAANYFPNEFAKFLEIYENEDKEIALRYLGQLKKVISETGGKYGVAGVKCMMNLVGYQGGYPRRPVLPVSAKAECQMREIMDTTTLLDYPIVI